jgi:hypothetical protein
MDAAIEKKVVETAVLKVEKILLPHLRESLNAHFLAVLDRQQPALLLKRPYLNPSPAKAGEVLPHCCNCWRGNGPSAGRQRDRVVQSRFYSE